MPRNLVILASLCLFSLLSAAQKKVIAVVGSSTAWGAGANPIDSSWVNLAKKYYQGLCEIDTIYNLGVPGSYSFAGMPTGD